MELWFGEQYGKKGQLSSDKMDNVLERIKSPFRKSVVMYICFGKILVMMYYYAY
jgi:hypothetical protein